MSTGDWSSLPSATATVYTVLVFVRAAWHKLADFGALTGFVANYELLPVRWVSVFSRGIIAAELGVVFALALPEGRFLGGLLAVAMLLGYAAAMALNLARGRQRIECGCGGAPQLLGWSLIVRNVALTGVATLVLLPYESGLEMSQAVVAVASGFTLWIGFVLIEQLLANASHARSSLRDSTW